MRPTKQFVKVSSIIVLLLLCDVVLSTNPLGFCKYSIVWKYYVKSVWKKKITSES